MNTRKIFRKILRGDRDFTPSSARSVRLAIAESLVLFFERLKNFSDQLKKEGKKMEKLSDSVPEFKDACLWKKGDDYIVTSYVYNMYAHEIMAFRSDENGAVTDWCDLACFRDECAHEECAEYAFNALANMKNNTSNEEV